jgi:hypothetical protein
VRTSGCAFKMASRRVLCGSSVCSQRKSEVSAGVLPEYDGAHLSPAMGERFVVQGVSSSSLVAVVESTDADDDEDEADDIDESAFRRRILGGKSSAPPYIDQSILLGVAVNPSIFYQYESRVRAASLMES